ncbi:hypothetical protein CYMTET_10457 [Cymbomonas tetramitiformis]|uniref:Uncharacterized protein n=1 Tax=Cymbomonas tetramitiformis TaxID=36881 RepID=A0AAE0GQN3_9CHLO|nr:hypothetical protein CYMTET_10457 [Cymbomonas tetramitiformis]
MVSSPKEGPYLIHTRPGGWSAPWVQRFLQQFLVVMCFAAQLIAIAATAIEESSVYQACLDDISGCTSLYLNHNSLTGTVPTELGLLSSAEELSLAYNSLTGTVPTELGLLSSATVLYLHENRLTGTVPTELGLLSSAQDLFLDHNRLTGTVPTELGLLSSAEGLPQLQGTTERRFKRAIFQQPDRHGAHGTGAVIERYKPCVRMDGAAASVPIDNHAQPLAGESAQYLHANSLTGTVPTELGLLSSATSLPQLQGTTERRFKVPETRSGTSAREVSASGKEPYRRLQSPQDAPDGPWLGDLHYNSLTGTVPTELGLLSRLRRLPQLQGTTERRFKCVRVDGAAAFVPIDNHAPPLAGESAQWLGGNNLTGTVPTELGLLSSAPVLVLSSNSLTGTVPTELGLLSSAEEL